MTDMSGRAAAETEAGAGAGAGAGRAEVCEGIAADVRRAGEWWWLWDLLRGVCVGGGSEDGCEQWVHCGIDAHASYVSA